jgi:aspartate kinase
MITTSEVAVSLTIDNDSALSSIKKELEALGTVELDSNQTIVSIVGNEIASTAETLQKVFNSLNGSDVRMVSYGGSAHNITILVPAAQKTQVLQQLNSGVFGL